MTEYAEPLPLPSQNFVPVCAIGASAGGVTALQQLFRLLPDDLGLAYVVILHLAPDQPSALSEILSVCTRMPVHEIQDGPPLRANCVFVIPPDRELVIEGDNVTARSFDEPRGRRAPIDKFFRSVAAARGDGIAVVLSGAGADGAQGVRSVKEAGGVIMVQEPADAPFPSMPQNAIATGVADFVAPLPRLAERLVEVAHSKEAVRSLDMDGSANDLRRIVAFLRARTGHDFSSYKRSTIMRRVVRRMQVCHTDTTAAYADYLLTTPEEAKELFSDLLISVTMFFRDPRAFDALERLAIKPVFDQRDPARDETVRAWIVGCATGEEAYSVAMLLHEEASRRKLHSQIQVFATDLDEGALATAREGRYPRTIEADVREDRLERFFTNEGTHYRVRKELRDSVVFASHSVVKDPPFMRLDLITCRNLLIYLERTLQQQLCAVFHHSLKPSHFLFLGSAETAETAAFTPLDRDARIYSGRINVTATLPSFPQFISPVHQAASDPIPPGRIERSYLPVALHTTALEQNAPASALVDDAHNTLHLSPSAGRFLLQSGGVVSNVLPAIVRPELRADLRLALGRAIERKEPTLTSPAVVAFEADRRRVSMHITPVTNDARSGSQALVFFLDGGSIPPNELQPDADQDTLPDDARRFQAELRVAQEALVASQAGHDAAVQDLRASNEELQSINEEYRSTAEELETSKEELQSINEELHTVNAELKSKLASISVAHNDLQNLTSSTEIGTLFLNPQLRIRMFTQPVAELFNITAVDIGRVVTDFTNRLHYDDFVADVQQVLDYLAPIEREVESRTGRSYIVRLRPYRTVEDRIDGTVVTFIDNTARRGMEVALRESEERYHALFTASPVPFMVLAPNPPDFTITAANKAYLAATLTTREGLIGRRLFDVFTDDPRRPGQLGSEALDLSLAHVLATRKTDAMERVRYDIVRPEGGFEPHWWLAINAPLLDADGNITAILHQVDRQTELHLAETALRDSESRMRTLVEGLPQLIWRSVSDGRWTWVSPQWLDYTGQSQAESQGWGWLETIHPNDRDTARQAWHEAQPHGHLAVEYRVRRARDGAWRWHQTRSAPVRGALEPDGVEGPILEWLGTATDIDDLKRLQDQQQVLVAELQHRTRNLLAVVRNVAQRSVDPSPGLSQYDARLSALGRVQGFLSRSAAYSVPLADVVQAELEAAGDGTSDRVRVDGPAVELPGDSVQAVALALHELATNAVKYGAIAQPSGRLSVTWHVERSDAAGDRRLVIDWRETEVVMPDGAPARRGYGSELITRALPYQLGAETALEFTADGVRCRVVLPVNAFISPDMENVQ